MQSHNPEFPLGTNFNFNDNLINPTSSDSGGGAPLPPSNSFLLLNGGNFLLLNGTYFLLLA